MLRVLFVIDNLGSGGAQRQSVALALRMRRRPDVVPSFLVYRESDFFGDRLGAAGIEVEQISKRFRYDPTAVLRIGEAFRRRQPDIVHAFLPAPSAWTAAALRWLPARARPKFVAAERSAPRALPRHTRQLLRWIYRSADAVTVNSQAALDCIRADFGVPSPRLHYVPNGIDLDAWDRSCEGPEPAGFEPGHFHVALVGRVEAEKNHLLLLRALSALGPAVTASWRVWFVGAETGPPEFVQRVKREVAERGLDSIIHFLPPQPAIGRLMRRLDAVVLPSHYEGFPNVVLEAMATRRVVLAAPVGDVPALVADGETGFLFAPDDVGSLAAGLRRLAGLPAAVRAAMGERARDRVAKSFQIEDIADRYLAVYRLVTASEATSAGRSSLAEPS